jgi:hypothetical protein
VGNRVKNIHLNTGFQWSVRAASKKCVNKADKRGVNVTGALSSQREKDSIRVCVMLGIIRVFCIACNLSSLRMSSLVRGTGGSKYKVTKEGLERRVKESDEDVRAFAGCNEGRPDAVGQLAFMDNWSCGLERIPMMDVGGGLGHFVRDEKGDIDRWNSIPNRIKHKSSAKAGNDKVPPY